MKQRITTRLLALLLTLCMLVTLLPAVVLFAAAEEPMTAADVFSQIESLRGSVVKKGRTPSFADFAAISDDVYDIVEKSGTAEDGTLTANGSFVSWVDEESGISCCYSPRHEADRAGVSRPADDEAIVESVQEAARPAMRGGSPSSLNIGLIQPFWDSASSYSDYQFREYSPQYKAQAEALASYTGGALYRYTLGNATPDAIAYTLQNCGLVIFDSHGGTDYENESTGDTTSRANCSYLWLESGSTSAAFIANADEYLLPADYATHEGPYGEYADYYLSSDGTYMVSGQLLANHMTGNAPNSFLYMGICLGMATDGMEAPLRAKGVEAVYGYSQSVSFSGEVKYMKAITNGLMDNQTLGEAVAAAKQTVGISDPGDYSSYYYYYYYNEDPAYPIVVSSEDEYPGHGNVDAVQNVNSAWTLIPTVTVTAEVNDARYGSVSVSGRAISAIPANGCYLVSAEVTEGEGSCTISGTNIIVHSVTDCTVLVTFAPKPEVTLSFSGIETADITGIADSLVRLPSPTSTYDGYTFIGWTDDIIGKTEDRPQFLKPGSYYTMPYEDITLYALYSYVDHTQPAKSARYVEIFTQDKLSIALEEPRSYLIVWDYYKEYDDEVVVFNANTDSPSSDPNYKIVEASADGSIVSNAITDSYAVRIEQINDTDTYSLRLMNGAGKYFGNTGGSNGINSKKTGPYPTTIRIAKYSSYSSTEYTLIENAEGDTVRTFCFHLTDSVSKFGFYEGFDGRQVHLYGYEPAIDGTLYYTGTPIICAHEGASSVTTAPTCTADGYIDHLCSLCGYKWTEAGEPATGHSYESTVVAPTATERGYTQHTCSVCGDTYQDNFTNPLGNDYQVDFVVLGNTVETRTVNSFSGTTLPTSVAINPEGYTFVGWSASEIPQEATGTKPLTGTYKPSGDTTLYAVYRRSEPYVGSGDYLKVTSAPDDFNGDYLIVYEGGEIAFNGSFATTLTNLNKAGNYLSVDIINNRIPGSSELDAAVVTFTKVAGSANNYNLKTKKNLAFGSTGGSTAGAINAGANNPSSVTFNSDKTVTIANVSGTPGTYNFAFNTSTTDRFSFWKPSTKTVVPICLYKKDGGGETYYFTTAPSVENCEHKQTTTVVTKPTCTEPGYTTYICKNCGETWTDHETAALGHIYIRTDNGENHIISCYRCDYSAEEAHTFIDGTCACGRKDFRVTSAQLILNGKIDLAYTASVPDDYETPYMVFSGPNGDMTVTNSEQDENGNYIFVYTGINPQCMGDNITATLYATVEDELQQVSIENYSVREYCIHQLAKDDISAELRTLLSDLLAYGAAAQTYMNYNTEAPVTEDVEGSSYSTFTDLSDLAADFEGEFSEDVFWVGAYLTLTDSVAMTFRFYTVDAAELVITVNIGGQERTFTSTDFRPIEDKEGFFEITIGDINATQFDEPVTARFTLWDEDMGETLSYSVNTYVCAKQNDSNTALADLVKALYNYGTSACAYANPEN